MRNHKKYRSTVLSLFSDFLTGKITERKLKVELYLIEMEVANYNPLTGKSVWFKFSFDDTLATTIENLYQDLFNKNVEFTESRMRFAIDNPKELQIYFS